MKRQTHSETNDMDRYCQEFVEEGKRISRVRIRCIGMKALDKMREALLQEPIVVDWAINKGYEA